jgi:hypothetical protein
MENYNGAIVPPPILSLLLKHYCKVVHARQGVTMLHSKHLPFQIQCLLIG